MDLIMQTIYMFVVVVCFKGERREIEIIFMYTYSKVKIRISGMSTCKMKKE